MLLKRQVNEVSKKKKCWDIKQINLYKGDETKSFLSFKSKNNNFYMTSYNDFFNSLEKKLKKNRLIKFKNIQMAGKTGTVQVVRISEEEREKGIIKNKDREWKKRDHALFVGYAPLEKPKYSICVVVEHGGSGSATAAPIAKDVIEKLLV